MRNFLTNILATKPVVIAILAAVTLAFLSMAISESKAATNWQDYTITIDKWITLDGEPADYVGQAFNVQVELNKVSSTLFIADKFAFDMPGTMPHTVFVEELYDHGESTLPNFSWDKWYYSYNGGAIGLANAAIFSSDERFVYSTAMRACVGGDIGIGCGHLTLGATEVAAVPVPAAIWLFCTALAGFGLVARRRRKTSEI